MFDVKDVGPDRPDHGATLAPVDFIGTVYFDFEGADSWRLFSLLTRAAAEGVRVNVEWVGFPVDGPGDRDALTPGVRALAAHAAVAEPARRAVIRQALFTLVHREGDSLSAELTYRAAAKVAGLDGDVLLAAIPQVGFTSLVATHERAVAAGITATPTIARHGPPVRVVSNPAIHHGPAKPRVELIDRMLEDDGIWELVKP
jgi:hypothetical protein